MPKESVFRLRITPAEIQTTLSTDFMRPTPYFATFACSPIDRPLATGAICLVSFSSTGSPGLLDCKRAFHSTALTEAARPS
jgi:hypothetical protein